MEKESSKQSKGPRKMIKKNTEQPQVKPIEIKEIPIKIEIINYTLKNCNKISIILWKI